MSDTFTKIFPRAYPEPVGHGVIKQSPEDFTVDEHLSFQLSGEGEHAYLQVCKTGQNTLWVVDSLARHFSVKPGDIGYAGLKDRNAVTTQWFSIPARFVSSEKISSYREAGVAILDTQLHNGKLRQGAIKYNQFKIAIRRIHIDESAIEERLHDICASGVPNYFDEQRFGRNRQNLVAADRMFRLQQRVKSTKRRIYLSAVRAWLFNQVVSERVNRRCWATGLDGDVFMLNGSRKYFMEDTMSEVLTQRLFEHDIHPTAPLWGEGELQTRAKARELEQSVLAGWQEWRRQLEQARMKQQRRATRVVPNKLEFGYEPFEHCLTVRFELPAGCYATNLIRELVSFE